MLGEYLFFIDCEGHYQQPDFKECLDIVKKKCSFYKFLGSYAKGTYYD